MLHGRMTAFLTQNLVLTLYRHIKTAEQRTIIHSFIHIRLMWKEGDITQLQTDREARKKDRIIKRLTLL